MKAIIHSTLIVTAGLLLTGCHTHPRHVIDPNTVYLEAAQRSKAPPQVVKEIQVPVPSPQLRRLPVAQVKKEMNSVTAQEAVTAAKDKATQGPDEDSFIEAVQMYDYLEGVVYEVFASPGHVTTIELQPGERLIAKVAGNTAQWVVRDSRAGSDESARTLLLVKPRKPNVQTNLVVSTNRRVYQIDLKSLPGVYHSAVAWNYPVDLITQLVEQYRQDTQDDDQVIERGVTIANLDFGYTLKSTTRKPPKWMPKRVFNDGHKTYIHFPDDLTATEAPPLFVLGDNPRDKQAQLVNYRVKANYYIVDQVIEHAQLRLGKTPQQIVTIRRNEQ